MIRKSKAINDRVKFTSTDNSVTPDCNITTPSFYRKSSVGMSPLFPVICKV